MSAEYDLAVKMVEMGSYPPGTPWSNQVVQTAGLGFLAEGSVVLRVSNGEVKEMNPPRARAYVKFAPDEWWIVLWHNQPCLVCSQFGIHKFAVIGGPDGWLCEEHKDDPIEHEGIVYGEMERR